VVHGVEMIADVPDMAHRPHQAKLTCQLGQTCVKLAKPHAGDGASNRPIRATNPFRRCGFEVPGVEVARPATQEDEDARPLGGNATKRAIAVNQGRNRPWKSESESANPASLKKLAARERRLPLASALHRRVHCIPLGKRAPPFVYGSAWEPL
jgi:hypothetical protein